MKGAFANTKETFVIHDDFFTQATDLCDFPIQQHIFGSYTLSGGLR
jgi:hypothetical protein